MKTYRHTPPGETPHQPWLHAIEREREAIAELIPLLRHYFVPVFVMQGIESGKQGRL